MKGEKRYNVEMAGRLGGNSGARSWRPTYAVLGDLEGVLLVWVVGGLWNGTGGPRGEVSCVGIEREEMVGGG